MNHVALLLAVFIAMGMLIRPLPSNDMGTYIYTHGKYVNNRGSRR
jgi:hypothetical protein